MTADALCGMIYIIVMLIPADAVRLYRRIWDRIRKAGYQLMKKMWCVLLALLFVLSTGCSPQNEKAENESNFTSEEKDTGSAEDALPFIEKAAAENNPPEDGVTRTYVRRKTSVKSEGTTCYVFKVVDDYGTYRKVIATYAASADGSIVLIYDIVTDEFVPLSEG